MSKHLAKSEEILYICESSPNFQYLNELNDLNIRYILNPEISEKTFKLISTIYPSPGISLEHEVFKYAKKLDIPIQTDIDIYLRNSQSYNILVTGTNGKTTTVSMLEHLLKGFLKDKSVAAIGNIGKPVLDFLEQKIDIAIIEISSFQIEASSELNSEIGILLNIEEDHLDRHKSLEVYKSLKTRVLKESSINIATLDYKLAGKKFYDYENYFSDYNIPRVTSLEQWPAHDFNNFKAALVALKLTLNQTENIEIEDSNFFLDKALKTISSFKKQPHRFELLENVDGILHVNDSKATNFDATVKSIESCRNLNKESSIFLICGGDLKGQQLQKKDASTFSEIKKCFIYGKDKETLKKTLSNFTDCICCDDIDSAYMLSKEESKVGDIILLSPLCSSTDMFSDYRERGNRFKGLINKT